MSDETHVVQLRLVGDPTAVAGLYDQLVALAQGYAGVHLESNGKALAEVGFSVVVVDPKATKPKAVTIEVMASNKDAAVAAAQEQMPNGVVAHVDEVSAPAK